MARAKQSSRVSSRALATALILASPLLVDAACISLKGSTTCPAFEAASVSTDDSTILGYYPFLKSVTDVDTFDEQLREYVETTYIQQKYQTRFGCGGIDLKNTTELYARFTTTTICNGIVQNSIDACDLSAEDSEPVCADTCADFASSVALITSESDLCSNPNSGVTDLIRAEFTTCALPIRSLSSTQCITGISNEATNCGFGNSSIGLCSYCASGGINSTDTCCYSSNAEERCQGVQLPSIIPTMSFATPTASASADADSDGKGGGLSGGAIAGIVIAALAGLLLLGALIFFLLRRRRNKQESMQTSSLNHPSPPRTGGSMAQRQSSSQGFDVLPGGRIARMSALEGEAPVLGGAAAATAAAAGAGAGYAAGRRKDDARSFSDFDSPGSGPSTSVGILRPPPTHTQRQSSVSSGSQIDPHSPGSAGGASIIPGGVASQQSEQLPFFKDYYSQDDIHPGDRVAVLWAYQPRAADEFALERGDMLKVVGIWDDGWATGVMLDERADEWEARRQAQRDSGVSSSTAKRESSPPVSGEIKAFPLVCICLPEHWRKTIEGDGSTDAGSSAPFGI